MRNKTHKQALLIGYYLKQELKTEPTVELIEKIINEHPNIDALTDTLEQSIAPDRKADFERQLNEIAGATRDKEDHPPRTVPNALTPEQIETIKQQKIDGTSDTN